MGNQLTIETLGNNKITYESKRIVAGKYAEYKDFTLYVGNIGDIPENTSSDYAVYDFESKGLLLLNNDKVPLIKFHPEKKLWEPKFDTYFKAVQSSEKSAN